MNALTSDVDALPVCNTDRPNSWEVAALRSKLIEQMVQVVGKNPDLANSRDWFRAVAQVVRGVINERFIRMESRLVRSNERRAYYLSMEFLLGRLLTNNLIALDLLEPVKAALAELGQDFEDVRACEQDPGLGNGGLGRLAACIIESLATLGYPGYGYGIRYQFGMFSQRIENGQQIEYPEDWLRHGNRWEYKRPSVSYPVRFYGRIITYQDAAGQDSTHWVETTRVVAVGYDMPQAGFRSDTLVNLRLWGAQSFSEFNLQDFNNGNFIGAVEEKTHCESLSQVLYPSDATERGQELRLKQEYFFVSASIQDILARFLQSNPDVRRLPEKVAIHLNDTHPTLGIPELMRILIDVHRLPPEEAWEITRKVFSYTNHTLLPEALETWSVGLMQRVLPRHLNLIYWINQRHLELTKLRYPGEHGILPVVSLIDDHAARVRMGYLSVVGSSRVNGVAALHTRLMCEGVFQPFHRMNPEQFLNVTNGVTPRRWLLLANPMLSALICSRTGDHWITDLTRLEALVKHADDSGFMSLFRRIKNLNKRRLASHIQKKLAVNVDPDSLFDIQVKRIHEYKRQLLNLLSVITQYNRLRDGSVSNPQPRTVIFAGKAAPGYYLAKLIIRLINDVAAIVNNDPRTRDALKLVFLPNYNVSEAEVIIPGCDLSEQISTAGTEASGTGNMKFALNGALTIGTLDGANVEIKDAVGEDNIFIFGLKAEEAFDLVAKGYQPRKYYDANMELRRALDQIRDGFFSPDEPERYRPILHSLLDGGDKYLVLADYSSYMACLDRADGVYRTPDQWYRMALFNVARMGHFSIDRTVHTYAREVWKIRSLNPFLNV
ncbi:MAG: glycogen/starch/alpha-glucan phosphorylase [Magnetococcales bacterium]|nr:glycogen/starch/alpha-glucan phosphorylase [Magnetococcales bacterium]MBF0156129.1 glycogen/starch/alpha-glucan phosphorylase [Magnetococcales bacterium]